MDKNTCQNEHEMKAQFVLPHIFIQVVWKKLSHQLLDIATFLYKSIVSFIQKGRSRTEYFLSEEKLENPEKSFILKPTCFQAVDEFCRKKKDDYREETKYKQENGI